jgi:hypothetical protein
MHKAKLFRPFVVVASAVLSLAIAAPAGAAVPVGQPVPGGPARASAAPRCTFAATVGSTCVQATAQLSRAPAVGETATLRLEVTSQIDLSGARIEVEFPALLTWQRRPAGFDVRHGAPVLPEDVGGVERASRVVDLRANRTARFEGTVKALAGGSLSVRVRAVAPTGRPSERAERMILAVVGPTPERSHLGLPPLDGPAPTTPVPAGAMLTRATPQLAFQPVRADKLAHPFTDDPPSQITPKVLSCATGSFAYEFPAGQFHPAANFQVQAWDSDTLSGDDLLATGLTDGNGGYRLCFDNNDVSGGQDVYMRFIAENGQWSVHENALLIPVYNFRTGVHNDIGNGRTEDFGREMPHDPLRHRAVHLFDDANDAANWTPGDCWDARDHDCRGIAIAYPDPDADDISFYDTGLNVVHIEDAAPDDRTLVVHELGHAVMDDVYEDNFPSCNVFRHEVPRTSSQGCAWTEGFADWYPTAVYNQPVIVGWQIDQPTWGTADWDTGDAVEGRVAGAMWDLADPPGEPTWDRYGASRSGRFSPTSTTAPTSTAHTGSYQQDHRC